MTYRTYRSFAAPLLGAVGLSLAAPVLAQQTDPGNDIVVEGERTDRREVLRTTRDITQRPGSDSEPVPRFQREICPGVWGLAPDNAQLVIDRIYDNAERAGIAINEEEGCGANIWVIVVDDPAATYAQLREENEFLVQDLSDLDKRLVERQEGPVRAWNITSTRNREGQAIASGADVAATMALSRSGSVGEPNNPVSQMSRLHSAVRLDLEMSVMLIQRSAIGEVDAFALADYATMRLLAHTEPPERENVSDTVLTLFSPDAEPGQPDRLTAFDRGYLRAVYDSTATRPYRLALRNVRRNMERELQMEIEAEQ
ncbi:hypothetical protein [Aurantiacibacter zhengii]|uniref:DUF2927 domain-containing protein n=1 Tax=Aurantiacibacter zhengii TaxID=2307003 RepID=A0A418NRL2_9SPHN|nr:hypothetical protein [Aurantiacibacter zhengii]RIV85688.1 hypothetical protein D2V07_10135 [Aurantiacibacter zhengii]